MGARSDFTRYQCIQCAGPQLAGTRCELAIALEAP
jgi:hypothetical protein